MSKRGTYGDILFELEYKLKLATLKKDEETIQMLKEAIENIKKLMKKETLESVKKR